MMITNHLFLKFYEVQKMTAEQTQTKGGSKIRWLLFARTSLRAINGIVTLFFVGLFGYFLYQQYLSLPRINIYQLTNAGVCFGIVATFIMIGQIIKHGFKGNQYWFKQLAIAGGVVAVIFGMPGLADGVLATIKGMLSQYF